MSSFVLSKHLLLCFLCQTFAFLEGIALAETVAYVIKDDSDGPFYTKYLAELYKTRLDYISLSCLGLQCLFFNCSIKPLFLVIYSSKLQSFEFSIL